MPDSGNKAVSKNRERGHCPICGHKPDVVTELQYRVEDGEREEVPGMHYDHSDSRSPTTVCVEWADGETEKN